MYKNIMRISNHYRVRNIRWYMTMVYALAFSALRDLDLWQPSRSWIAFFFSFFCFFSFFVSFFFFIFYFFLKVKDDRPSWIIFFHARVISFFSCIRLKYPPRLNLREIWCFLSPFFFRSSVISFIKMKN